MCFSVSVFDAAKNVMVCFYNLYYNRQTSFNRTNLGRVFNSRSGCMCAMHLCCYEAKRPNLKLKTLPRQLLGSLPLAFMLLVLLNSVMLMVRPFPSFYDDNDAWQHLLIKINKLVKTKLMIHKLIAFISDME
jgi:hypothetical protein